MNGIGDILSDDLVGMSAAGETRRGQMAKAAFLSHIAELFRNNKCHLRVEVEEMVAVGDLAYDRGELEVTLIPKDTQRPITVKQRFLEIWRKNKNMVNGRF